ncbi:hypothetical protein ACS0TY_036099 [Phlomoides rotata]
MADEEDDFTFPATAANLPPCSFESPPLWRRPPRLENEEEAATRFELCSCEACNAMNIGTTMGEGFWYVDDEIIKEEKMDLLWEDLDEKCERNYGKMVEDYSDNSSSPGRNVKICCVKTLKLSKLENGITINGLKASFLELIRFLMKKGFSMHNSGW